MPAIEAIRTKGQVWTPQWVARPMVMYAGKGTKELFDPAVGAGAFQLAAKSLGCRFKHYGHEIDSAAISEARTAGLSDSDLAGVRLEDFLAHPYPERSVSAVVANPPYLRHHRLGDDRKRFLRQYSARLLGTSLDGRTGLHVYFLIKALSMLRAGGRLSFILPADSFEGIFSKQLWSWVTRNYRLDAVISFTKEASPFPGVDTNPLIVCLANSAPSNSFPWAQCTRSDDSLERWFAGEFRTQVRGVMAHARELSEALATGLSRATPSRAQLDGRPLGDFARVVRGIATGANDFFYMTRESARQHNIPDEYLLPAVSKTRDVPEDTVDAALMRELETSGKPNLLLSIGATAENSLPPALRRYLEKGARLGLSERPLIRTRKPWYKMETRSPAPRFLFAYLGRRRARFIDNRIGAMPLSGFLCVYPKDRSRDGTQRLWAALSDQRTIDNLGLVGKSYGGGAIKVEPRSLERLIIPRAVLESVGLPLSPTQSELFALT